MVDVVVEVDDTASVVNVYPTTPAAVTVELGGTGPRGLPGADGADGLPGTQGPAGNTNVYIQQTEPAPATGTGAFIWYVTDGTGAVTDIRKGVA